MNFQTALNQILNKHHNVKKNISRQETIFDVVENKEAVVSQNGALATWAPKESTGRSPKDTYIVRRPEVEKNIDWNSPSNFSIEPIIFEMLWQDALNLLQKKSCLYITDRVVGADSSYALPIRTITDRSLLSLFTLNMFRSIPSDIHQSIFNDNPFTLLALPYDKIETTKYKGKLRKLSDGSTSDMVIIIDFEKRIGLIFGSAYCGSCKKLIFTVMNYYLPLKGILSLHCSANESLSGELSLFLGLSGTGKTTLSADPQLMLLGDDEHGWSDHGVANFENGCYAKLINLNQEKEPEIFHALFHKQDYQKHGAIIENALMYPNKSFDLNDDRLTPNSRGSYPLSFLKNIKESSCGPHPKTIIFLTADATGILPPIASLSSDQAMLWFLMGYTSKLAGTETGIIIPEATFSRFFGQPFMPCLPDIYTKLLGKKMQEHQTNVYLINTGWSGGPYGVGKRMDISLTRSVLNAALNGSLVNVEYQTDHLFHLNIPLSCPGVPSEILIPANTWKNKQDYQEKAQALARAFSNDFDKSYGSNKIDEKIKSQCPGK